jgi:hypothetical protein
MPVTMDPDASIKAGAAGADSVQPLALAMILPGRQSSRCRGNDRYPTRPRSAAAHGAMQVTVSGNNAGKITPLLSHASSDGARCTTLAAGYHHHRWKD